MSDPKKKLAAFVRNVADLIEQDGGAVVIGYAGPKEARTLGAAVEYTIDQGAAAVGFAEQAKLMLLNGITEKQKTGEHGDFYLPMRQLDSED